MSPRTIVSIFFFIFSGLSLGPAIGATPEPRQQLPQVPYRGELRLRLEDPVQERRTTSLNWLDLPGTVSRVMTAPKIAALQNPNTGYGRTTVRPKTRPVRIVIDAGHGGHDWGAGGFFGLLEKEISLKASFLLQRQIERQAKLRDIAVDVRLTRFDDQFISLKDRVALANQWRADVFLSIHANSGPSNKLSGFEVYFQSPEATDDHSSRVAYVENQASGKRVESDVLNILKDAQATVQIQQSSEFAERVYSSMTKHMRPNIRGVRQAPFTVLSGAEMPALLIEVGYVTHKQEAENLARQAYLKRIAGAISSGVFDYISMLRPN